MTHLIPLADALGPIREVYRHLLTAAARWQEGRPRRTDPDHFALICVAADAGFGRQVSPTRWARTDVYHVLRIDIPNWCSTHRCLWPVEISEALWEWFDFLSASGRMDPASDPLWELRKPLLCYGGLDFDGRIRPELFGGGGGAGDDGGGDDGDGDDGDGDGDDVPRLVECECHLPYRETVTLLNRLGLQCEYRGQSPTDVLRALVGDGPRHPGPAELDELLRDLRDDMRDIERGGIPGFPYDEDDPSCG